jgi:hypothetical protein
MSPRVHVPEPSPDVPTISPRQPPAHSPEAPELLDPSPGAFDHLSEVASDSAEEFYQNSQQEEIIEKMHKVRKSKIAEVLAERRMQGEAESQVSQTSEKQFVKVSVQTNSVVKSCRVEVHIHGLESLQLHGIPEQAVGA